MCLAQQAEDTLPQAYQWPVAGHWWSIFPLLCTAPIVTDSFPKCLSSQRFAVLSLLYRGGPVHYPAGECMSHHAAECWGQ